MSEWDFAFELTGQALEDALSDYNGTILTVSHDRYFINRIADHILEITENGELLSCTIDGKEIDPHRIYTVATIDYLAEGNDKMYALKKAVKRHDIGILARDIMMEYVIKHRVIDSKIEGRITIK